MESNTTFQERNQMDKKKVREVMSWMGTRNTEKQTKARRENMKKAMAKRWVKKVVDSNS